MQQKMKKIKLTQDKFAIVDDEDFERLNQWKWYFDGRYATRALSRKLNNGKQKRAYMHREILKPKIELSTDHINGNTLDNRKLNLREATTRQNGYNRKIDKRNSTGYPNIYFRPHYTYKKWAVYIPLMNKNKFCGGFANKEDAINRAKELRKKHYGEFTSI